MSTDVINLIFDVYKKLTNEIKNIRIINKYYYQYVDVNKIVFDLNLIKESILRYYFENTIIDMSKSYSNVCNIKNILTNKDVSYINCFSNLKTIQFAFSKRYKYHYKITLCSQCQKSNLKSRNNKFVCVHPEKMEVNGTQINISHPIHEKLKKLIKIQIVDKYIVNGYDIMSDIKLLHSFCPRTKIKILSMKFNGTNCCKYFDEHNLISRKITKHVKTLDIRENIMKYFKANDWPNLKLIKMAMNNNSDKYLLSLNLDIKIDKYKNCNNDDYDIIGVPSNCHHDII